MKIDRRNILRGALGGGALAPLVLPERWTRPVVKTLVVPAHAAASPATTTATTTTFVPPLPTTTNRG
ncbi:MAG: hypothetical protein P4M07_26385 [Xanthobacteraceae bacterium]|nr:hypothetical protein [Xanthobacteraceae bacterium]